MTDHFFIVQKELYLLKVWGLLCLLFTLFSYLLLCQKLEFIGFGHRNKKQLPPEKKSIFYTLCSINFYSSYIFIFLVFSTSLWCDQYVLLQFELLTLLPKHQPTSDPHESLMHEQIFICPGLCTPFIQSGKKDKFPWQAGGKKRK